MKTQRLLIALTVLNLGLLTLQLARPRLAFAQEPSPVLRGRALEIVDERGKVRAQLSVFPADPKHKLPNGDPYPETIGIYTAPRRTSLGGSEVGRTDCAIRSRLLRSSCSNTLIIESNTHKPASSAGSVAPPPPFISRPLSRPSHRRTSDAPGASLRDTCQTTTHAMLATSNRLANAGAVSCCHC